jgi:hypothetical protein
MKNNRERERAFVEEVKKALQEKGEKLDPEILVKLSSLRGGVVESRGSGFAGPWRLIRLPIIALLSGGLIVLLALALLRGPATLRHSFAGLEDLDLLTAEEGPDFYANLDFYDWLASRAGDERQKP